MLRIKQRTLDLKISLFTFSKEISKLLENVFKNVCNKTGHCIAFALMSGDVLAMNETIYNFHIRITFCEMSLDNFTGSHTKAGAAKFTPC